MSFFVLASNAFFVQQVFVLALSPKHKATLEIVRDGKSLNRYNESVARVLNVPPTRHGVSDLDTAVERPKRGYGHIGVSRKFFAKPLRQLLSLIVELLKLFERREARLTFEDFWAVVKGVPSLVVFLPLDTHCHTGMLRLGVGYFFQGSVHLLPEGRPGLETVRLCVVVKY